MELIDKVISDEQRRLGFALVNEVYNEMSLRTKTEIYSSCISHRD